MRVRIVFELKNKGAMVNFHHQPLISSFIKSFTKTHEFWSNFSHYTFSALKGQTRTSKQGLHFFSDKVTLVLASPNPSFVKFIVDKINAQEQIALGELQLRPLQVERELFPPLEKQVKLLCISPLVLTDPVQQPADAKKFISPSLDKFSDLIYEQTIARMEKSGRYSNKELDNFHKFQIIPDKNYLQKIKNNDKKFARIYAVQNGSPAPLELRGYTFPFILYADPLVQEFVVEAGLGAFTNYGYGMVDLVDDYLTKRINLPEYQRTETIASTTANELSRQEMSG